MSEEQDKLTVTKNIPLTFGAFRETEVSEEDRKKGVVGFIHMQYGVEGMLAFYREHMISAAQAKDLKRFDECLAEWLKFKLAEMAGLENIPVKLGKDELANEEIEEAT